MSFNSRQYLAHEERLLLHEPQMRGTRRNTSKGLTDLWAAAERVKEIEEMQRKWEEEMKQLKTI